MDDDDQSLDEPLRTGTFIFIGLAVLTLVEFWVAVGGLAASLTLLVLVAVAKAGLILEYYMHVRGLNETDHEAQS